MAVKRCLRTSAGPPAGRASVEVLNGSLQYVSAFRQHEPLSLDVLEEVPPDRRFFVDPSPD